MRDGTRTRARIEEEALRLFAAQGVEGTSVRDIAQAVGVAEGALYRHFASKDELARLVFLTHYAEMAQAILAIDARPLDILTKIDALVLYFLALFETNRPLFTFLLVNQHHHLEGVPEAEDANAVAALCGLFKRAMARGEIPAGDAELLTAMTLGTVIQPAIFRLYGRLKEPLDKRRALITRAIAAIVMGQTARVRVAAGGG